MTSAQRESRSGTRFIDKARIFVKAGDGGDGAVTFRREKYVPRGGPDGGDGGHGGTVILRADPSLRTLIDCVLRHRYEMRKAGNGARNRRHGANGENLVIRVPVGTLIRRDEDGALLADLATPGQECIAAKGGKGGRGNSHFATPTRQAPRFAETGEPGESRWLSLELRLLADVGIVGLPNAGKSTLISRISAARPKTAPYPFTTLSPNLGVVRIEEGTSFVVADMPGLIEGAHAGAGLGHEFLRHIERTRLLVHMLDISDPDTDPVRSFDTINEELRLHRAWLANLPQIVALNKVDLPEAQVRLQSVTDALKIRGYDLYPVSALAGQGVDSLVKAIAFRLSQSESAVIPGRDEETIAELHEEQMQVERISDDSFLVTGDDVERQARMLDPDNPESMAYLYRKLGQMGVLRRLARAGAQIGDRVIIGERELEFHD